MQKRQMFSGNLVSAKGLLLAGELVLAGTVVLIAWFLMFFAASNRDPWIVWALYYVMKAAWIVLIVVGLVAFVSLGVMLLVKQ